MVRFVTTAQSNARHTSPLKLKAPLPVCRRTHDPRLRTLRYPGGKDISSLTQIPGDDSDEEPVLLIAAASEVLSSEVVGATVVVVVASLVLHVLPSLFQFEEGKTIPDCTSPAYQQLPSRQRQS